MKPIPITEAYYIAAFFDAEGHIGIHRSNSSRTPVLKVVGVNTHLATLKMIQEYLGGHIGRKKGKDEHQQGWQLQLRVDELPRFIKEIVPYLRTKAANGLLLEKAYSYYVNGWTDAQIEQVHAQYAMIKGVRLESPVLITR